MNTILKGLISKIHIFLAVLCMTLLLGACTSDSGGYSDDSGGGGNGCQEGYCNSNGVCCPSNYRYECQGSCYASSSDANAAHPGQCSDFRTEC